MKLIYVAAPFTATGNEGIRANIAAAAALGHDVRMLGAGAIVPHLIGSPYVAHGSCCEFRDSFGYKWWIAETLEQLRRCDAVIMGPGWENSNGARGEYDDAVSRQQPVFLSLAELKTWLTSSGEDLAAVGAT